MIFKDKFLKNNLLIFFSTSIVNLANLFYQVLVVRRLSVASYGEFNSLFSFFTVIIFPVSSIATMIAKFIPHYSALGEVKKAYFFVRVMLRQICLVSFIIFVLYALFGAPLKDYLRLTSVFPVYLTGAMLFFALISVVIFGGLQGFEKFAGLSINNLSGSLLKLLLAFIFLSSGWGLIGALSGYLIAQIAALGIGAYWLREIFLLRKETFDINIKEKYRFIVPSFVTLICISTLTNIDVILVKHFFEPSLAGYYSVAQLIGKIVLFIPGAIYIVMLPRTSALHVQNKDARPLLRKALAYTGFLCLSVTAGYNLAPEFILGLLSGKTAADIVFLGRIFSIAMTFFSLLLVLLIYQLSVSDFRYIKTLVIFTVMQVIAISLFHNSLPQILSILLINSAILFAVNFRLAMKQQGR